jgi:hypothetical protein
MLKQEPRDHKDQAFAVLTIQQQCGAVFHGLSLRILSPPPLKAALRFLGTIP